MRIISDTADPRSSYAEIYSDQRQRIRSSVVYPILSSEYELLGTLVLHCDRTAFFLEEDRKFWRDFCELFAKRIALEKQLLDKATIPSGDEQLGAGAWAPPPF
jgi:GAF domain-containing protein